VKRVSSLRARSAVPFSEGMSLLPIAVSRWSKNQNPLCSLRLRGELVNQYIAGMCWASYHSSHCSSSLMVIIIIDNRGVAVNKFEKYMPIAGYFYRIKALLITTQLMEITDVHIKIPPFSTLNHSPALIKNALPLLFLPPSFQASELPSLPASKLPSFPAVISKLPMMVQPFAL
jgi:hypothetical protein